MATDYRSRCASLGEVCVPGTRPIDRLCRVVETCGDQIFDARRSWFSLKLAERGIVGEDLRSFTMNDEALLTWKADDFHRTYVSPHGMLQRELDIQQFNAMQKL